MIVWRREPNRGRQRQIRISSDPLEIDENCYTGPIWNVDSDGEVRFTLHMIVWRREPNRGRQRQIRISSDPLEIDENCYTDPISNVDSDGEVRLPYI